MGRASAVKKPVHPFLEKKLYASDVLLAFDHAPCQMCTNETFYCFPLQYVVIHLCPEHLPLRKGQQERLWRILGNAHYAYALDCMQDPTNHSLIGPLQDNETLQEAIERFATSQALSAIVMMGGKDWLEVEHQKQQQQAAREGGQG